MIPVPENNSTPASFMETISELYIHEAENNEIARKLISRFQDHIGKKWFLHNISELSPESLANKTGVGLEEINDLRMLMAKAMNDEHISDEELMRLEQLIQMFYKT